MQARAPRLHEPNQMQSDAIRCNQMQSVVIRGHQRSSRAPRLHEPNVFERGARCDPKLSLHEIDAGHLLRHCVLHLRASGAR